MRKAMRDLPSYLVHYVKDVESWTGWGDNAQVWTPSFGKGETWNMGDYQNATPADATHIVFAEWGDYGGSDIDRSNCEAILRDFPRSTCEVIGGHNSHGVMVSADSRNEALGDAIRGLADYPLYDDEHHSEMEMNAADEAWGDYLSHDVRNDVTDYFGRNYDADEFATDLLEVITDETLQDWFNEYDGSSYPYFESATSIVFPDYDEQVAYIAGRMIGYVLEYYRESQPELPFDLTCKCGPDNDDCATDCQCACHDPS